MSGCRDATARSNATGHDKCHPPPPIASPGGDTSKEDRNDMTSNAVFEIEFTCGHIEDRDLSDKPAGERRGYVSWLAKQKCTACWQRTSKRTVSKEVQAERAAALASALEDQERSGLPILQGSEKQVSWAVELRHGLLRSAYSELVESGEKTEDEFDTEVLELVRRIDRAKWWIDNRECDTAELLELLADPGEATSGTFNENPY